jgi:hypothetical protein
MCIGYDVLEYQNQVSQTGVEDLGATKAMGFEELEAKRDNRGAITEAKTEAERGRKRKDSSKHFEKGKTRTETQGDDSPRRSNSEWQGGTKRRPRISATDTQ